MFLKFVDPLGCFLLWLLWKWLLGMVGMSAYTSASGNFLLSGVMLLNAVVAAVYINTSKTLFHVEDKDQTEVFIWSGSWILIGIAGCAAFVVRALGILSGIFTPSEVPSFLRWLF